MPWQILLHKQKFLFNVTLIKHIENGILKMCPGLNLFLISFKLGCDVFLEPRALLCTMRAVTSQTPYKSPPGARVKFIGSNT